MREDRGVRVFNFSALVDAAVARSINNALPRIPLKPIMQRIDQQRRLNIEEALARPASDPYLMPIEISGIESSDVRNSPKVAVTGEFLGSPVEIQITIDLTRICAELVLGIIKSKSASE